MANYYNMYNGNQPFNDTIHLNGPAPLDDREVFSSVEGLYFTHGEKNHPLVNRAYKGMQVVIFDGSASIFMILNDATPYSADNTTVNVTAQNYLDYWAILSGSEYKIVKADVANAGMILPKCEKVKAYDLPKGQTHNIFLLTKGGVYKTQLHAGLIPETEPEMRTIYVLYQKVLNELRNCQLKDEAERQKNKA